MNIKSIKLFSMGMLTLGLAGAAHATGAGMYIGMQGGKTYTHNKPVTLQTCQQMPDGSYNCNSDITGTETLHPANTGVGGRIFAGYNVSQYWGLEGGFTHYALTTIKVPKSPPLKIGNPTGNPGISENGFDFVGKAMYSFGSFGIYGKAGIAIIKVGKAGTYITTFDNTTGTYTRPNGTTGVGTFVIGSRANTYVRPTAGIGLTYDFTQNWQVEFSAARVFGGGGMQPADLVALGFSYHFVDKFCGQFLC